MITDEDAKVSISRNVNRILKEQGKSVYWLRNELGVGQGTIYPIVRGEVCPSVAMAARIAEILGVSLDSLVDFETSEKKS